VPDGTAAISAAQIEANNRTLTDNAYKRRAMLLDLHEYDHAAHAIGAYGGRLAKLNPTPTIDRLAREGMLFENCFAVNSICTPSRASVLTGQYNHTNEVYDLTGHLEDARQLLPNELNSPGSRTQNRACAGPITNT
jgi:hypothetical protein